MSEQVTGTNAKEKKTAKAEKAAEAKVKLALTTVQEHPLNKFIEETKKRNIKDLDLNEFVATALAQLPQSWWDEQLENLTPLEYKISQALSDPAMREKLSALLVNTSSSNDMH